MPPTNRPPWEIARERRDAQMLLRRTQRIVSLGTGPDPAVRGWPTGPDSWLRCVVCGYVLKLDGKTTDRCWCEALASDAGAARVGSAYGDEAIERVRLEPIQPG